MQTGVALPISGAPEPPLLVRYGGAWRWVACPADSDEPIYRQFTNERNDLKNRHRLIVVGFLMTVSAALALPLVATAGSKPAGQPAVQVVDGPGLKKAIASQRGKVVVLNLWATWCQPCVEEFPDLVKLHNSYRSRGLVVMAASVDEPETQSKVRPFLTAQKATFPAFVRKLGDAETFINAIDKNWSGPVPTTYIYDRNGRQVGKPLVGGQTYATFAHAVEPLLK
jgi:thiol-disulfide isomerase/thioredoxin